MSFEPRFDLDAVVEVTLDDGGTFEGVLKHMDKDEVWLECLLWGKGWAIGKVMVQRSSIRVVRQLSCPYGCEEYARRRILLESPHANVFAYFMGALKYLQNMDALADVVCLPSHDSGCYKCTHGHDPAEKIYGPLRQAALERISDRDILQKLSGESNIEKNIHGEVMQKLANLLPASGAPYRRH